MRLDLEEWRDLVEPFYDVHPSRSAPHTGVEIDVKTTNGLLITELSACEQTLIHDPNTRRNVCHEYVLFERFFTGGGAATVADEEFEVTTTRFHVIDMSQRYVSRKRRSRSRGVCIPHSLLGFVPGQDVAFASLDLDTPAGRLIALAHSEVMAAGDSDASMEIIEAFAHLVRRFILGPTLTHGRPDPSDLPVHVLMHDYVETHLDRPDLDADLLISVFGLSRSALYRQFEAEGGVQRFIRNRRLDRCYLELSSAPPLRGQVSQVAQRWQFYDPTHFNRLFRARFGVSPSRCHSARTGSRFVSKTGEMHPGTVWLDQIRHA